MLVYNPNATQPGEHRAPRTPLCVAISEDGEHWQLLATLEDGPISEYSYPAVVEGRDGTIHITYTWRRERICHVELRLRKITMPLLLKKGNNISVNLYRDRKTSEKSKFKKPQVY